jgi:hypothetical protein
MHIFVCVCVSMIIKKEKKKKEEIPQFSVEREKERVSETWR